MSPVGLNATSPDNETSVTTLVGLPMKIFPEFKVEPMGVTPDIALVLIEVILPFESTVILGIRLEVP